MAQVEMSQRFSRIQYGWDPGLGYWVGGFSVVLFVTSNPPTQYPAISLRMRLGHGPARAVKEEHEIALYHSARAVGHDITGSVAPLTRIDSFMRFGLLQSKGSRS